MATIPAGATFAHPTVKQVIFQIRFPKLFFMQSKIGDLQLGLMQRFPKSESVVHRAVIMAQGTNESLQQLLKERPDDDEARIWKFEDAKGVVIEVKLDSLTILSTKHTSYANQPDPFRETLSFVTAVFFKQAPIPVVARVGLRYVDECPFPTLTNDTFSRYFDSCLPVGRFPIERGVELVCRAVCPRDGGMIRYAEAVVAKDNGHVLVVDMDAFAEHVASASVLDTADKLHQIVRREFEATIKEPVLHYMRTGELQP